MEIGRRRQWVAAVAAFAVITGAAHAGEAPRQAAADDSWWKPGGDPNGGAQSAAAPAATDSPDPAPAGDASTASTDAPSSAAPGADTAPEADAQQGAPAAADAPAAAVATIPATAAPPPGDAKQGPATQLEDVVVTAQKREQRAVDVPINLSTLGRDDIQKTRIEQVRDVMGYVPNVDIKEQVPGAIPVVTIRGVGLDDFSSTNSPAAGIYVDQVTLSSLALMSFDLYDMERIEVLKGPQGTLYGRNSNAGAINVITASPTQNREGFLRAGYGSYQAKDLEAMYNLPLGDTLAVRVAGKFIKQDEGYWKSREGKDEAYSGNSASYTSDRPTVRDVGRRDIRSGRVRVAWNPLDALSLDLKVEDLRQRSEMGQPEFFGTQCGSSQPIDPNNCSDLLGYKDTDRDPYRGDWRGDFPYNIDQTAETLLADYDLGWATLSSVTGHIDFKRFFHIDVDATPADEFDFFQGDTVNQLTQELRLGGAPALGNWLLGLFYSTDQATVNTPGRHENLIPNETSLILADQHTRSGAAFGNMEWKLGALRPGSPLLDKFSVTTGLRYTTETRRYVGGTTWSVVVPGTIDDTHEDSSIDDQNWSWKAGLNFAPTAATLLYASAAHGVKSGGYFSGVTTNQRQLAPYLPEGLTAYEVGGKLAGVVALNGSLFHYDYRNLQTFMRDGSAPVQFVGNVPQATIDGADVDTTIRLFDGLTAVAGVGLLRSKLGAFAGPSGTPVAAGNQLANSPDFTWNALLRYELPILQTGLVAAVQGDAHYASAMFKEATNDPLIKSDPYTIYNARASLLSAGREWEFALWGKNLTDERYVVQGVDIGTFGMGNRNYNAPRTYGADLLWHF